jgi:hypothetical protein
MVVPEKAQQHFNTSKDKQEKGRQCASAFLWRVLFKKERDFKKEKSNRIVQSHTFNPLENINSTQAADEQFRNCVS